MLENRADSQSSAACCVRQPRGTQDLLTEKKTLPLNKQKFHTQPFLCSVIVSSGLLLRFFLQAQLSVQFFVVAFPAF